MKAIILPCSPIECERIVNGDMSILVRKVVPKEVPFRVYIYCTLPSRKEMFSHGGIREYSHELIRLIDGSIVCDYGMQVCVDGGKLNRLPNSGEWSKDNFLCQKVIGSFICDKTYNLEYLPDEYSGKFGGEFEEMICKGAGLSFEEIKAYKRKGNKKAYGLNITESIVYDKPKILSDFYRCGAETVEELFNIDNSLCAYCSKTNYGENSSSSSPQGMISCEGRYCDEAYAEYLDDNFALTHPPTTYMYVKDLED